MKNSRSHPEGPAKLDHLQFSGNRGGIAAFITSDSASADFYVALDGNDAWSGKLAAPNPAGTDGPCASLARARNAVRAPKSVEVPRAPLTVIIRGGKYFLHEALTFTNDDSGIAEAPSPAGLIRASSRF